MQCNKSEISKKTGYVKDCVACALFALAFIVILNIRDLNVTRPYLLFFLLNGFLIDGCYAASPCYHFEDFGDNYASSIIISGLIVSGLFCVLFVKRHMLR
tara:strand:- start:1501 stop:1800 length:300 start_codon:yes stop_codon:yes gene_type:complete